jgi:hypothetical protein
LRVRHVIDDGSKKIFRKRRYAVSPMIQALESREMSPQTMMVYARQVLLIDQALPTTCQQRMAVVKDLNGIAGRIEIYILRVPVSVQYQHVKQNNAPR